MSCGIVTWSDVVDRLTHQFEHVALEFGKLVEK